MWYYQLRTNFKRTQFNQLNYSSKIEFIFWFLLVVFVGLPGTIVTIICCLLSILDVPNALWIFVNIIYVSIFVLVWLIMVDIIKIIVKRISVVKNKFK